VTSHTAATAELYRRRSQSNGARRHLRVSPGPTLTQHPAGPRTARATVRSPRGALTTVRARSSARGTLFAGVVPLGVVILLPLILIAGLVALVGTLAIGAVGNRAPAPQATNPSHLAPLVPFDGAQADISLSRAA
jgi:hypothetical protein